jgi:hypothetical protein
MYARVLKLGKRGIWGWLVAGQAVVKLFRVRISSPAHGELSFMDGKPLGMALRRELVYCMRGQTNENWKVDQQANAMQM